MHVLVTPMIFRCMPVESSYLLTMMLRFLCISLCHVTNNVDVDLAGDKYKNLFSSHAFNSFGYALILVVDVAIDVLLQRIVMSTAYVTILMSSSIAVRGLPCRI